MDEAWIKQIITIHDTAQVLGNRQVLIGRSGWRIDHKKIFETKQDMRRWMQMKAEKKRSSYQDCPILHHAKTA